MDTAATTDLQPLIERLRQGERLAATDVAAFSGLLPEDRVQLAGDWSAISEDARLWLIETANELADDDPLLDFVPLVRLAVRDPSAAIRRAVAEGLWEAESPEVARDLIVLLDDTDGAVRGAAATSLQRFVALHAEDHLRPAVGDAILTGLRRLAQDDGESPEVRSRAIEALGPYIATWVDDLVADAFDHEDRELRLGALRAMAASGNEEWAEYVTDTLASDDPEMRFLAAVAAGEIATEHFTDTVAMLLHDDDPEVAFAAIHALGEIGGEAARTYLDAFRREADEAFADDIEAALENARFNAGDPEDVL